VKKVDEQRILQVLLEEFYDKLQSLEHLVKRDAQFPNTPNKIKVAIGMRRAGKTSFIYQQILKLLKEGIKETKISGEIITLDSYLQNGIQL
jgi:uncharacterized protein